MALSMYRGNTKAFNVTVTQNGITYDLDNAAGLYFTARTDAGAEPLFSKSLSDGITITNAAGGLATITLAPADTAGLPSRPVTLKVDLELETDSGAIHTVYYGTLAVEPDITVR